MSGGWTFTVGAYYLADPDQPPLFVARRIVTTTYPEAEAARRRFLAAPGILSDLPLYISNDVSRQPEATAIEPVDRKEHR